MTYPMTANNRNSTAQTAPTIIPALNSAGPKIPDDEKEVDVAEQFSFGRKILASLDGTPLR